MCNKSSIKIRTRQVSWRTLRCGHARQSFDGQLRLQADDVRQPVCKQVAQLGVHRGNSTEDKAAYGEQHRLKDARHLENFGAEAVVVGHILQQPSSAHLFLPYAQAEVVILGIEVEVTHHQTKACEATPAGKVESPVEDSGDHEVGVVEVVDAGRRKDDGEMGRKEVSFEEAVIQRQEVRLVYRFGRHSLGLSAPWNERFVQTGRRVERGPIRAAVH
jgi:hypothetical protein